MEVGIAWDDRSLGGEVGMTTLDALLQEKRRKTSEGKKQRLIRKN